MTARTLWRHLLDALRGPGYDPTFPYRPRRGDAVEEWLIGQRGSHADGYPTPPPGWWAIDAALRDFRAAADAGVGLGQYATSERTP